MHASFKHFLRSVRSSRVVSLGASLGASHGAGVRVFLRAFLPAVLIALGGATLSLCPAHAHAQADCPEPGVRGPVDVTPASGAFGVRLDAPVRVRFTDGFFSAAVDPDLEDFLVVFDDALRPVPGRVDLLGDNVLFFVPREPWTPGARYSGVAVGELDLRFSFTAGTGFDTGPPFLDSIREVTSSRVDATCNAPDGGFRVEVRFPVANDDGAPGSIEYTLYLARGGSAPRLVDRVRNVSADRSAVATMAFVVPAAEVEEVLCVQVQATDGVGQVSVSDLRCFDPVTGPHFRGLCDAQPGAGRSEGAPTGPLLALFLAAAAAAVHRLRRHSRRRAR